MPKTRLPEELESRSHWPLELRRVTKSSSGGAGLCR